MLKKEAGIISQELKLILKKRNFLKCLDIGSSTFEFRTKIQPFIQREIFMPLENRGIKIFHLDKKEDRGVDIVSKIEDIDRIRKKFDLILCFNVLEHVENPYNIAKKIERLATSKATLILSTPLNYPYHPDPIDNLFRPSPQELRELFPDWNLSSSRIITGDWKNRTLLFIYSNYSLIKALKFKNILKNSLIFLKSPKVALIVLER